MGVKDEFRPKVNDWTTYFHQCRSAICRQNRLSARRWDYNVDGAGQRSHDSQSRDRRRNKLDMVTISANGVSATVKICEWEPRWSQNTMTSILTKPHFFQHLSSRISFETQKKGTLWWEARTCTWDDDDTKTQYNRLKMADAVENTFQTASRWGSCASAGTRSAWKNRHNVGFRSKHTFTSERRVCQNLRRVVTLGRMPR